MITAQSASFNHRISLEDRSTRVRDICFYQDTLLVVGELGTDSLGLAGIFLLKMDTFGTIVSIKYFRDPNLLDHLLMVGREPILVNSVGNIVLAGEYFEARDIYLLILDTYFEILEYRQYDTDFLTLFAEDITEFGGEYYISGFVQPRTLT